MIYEFTAILRGCPELTDLLINSLFEAGCDDSLPGTVNGVTQITFMRDAESLEEAIQSAIADIEKAGCKVDRIETEETAAIDRLNRKLQTA